MKNTLVDLNNHLFEQLERLNDESLDDEALKREITRSKAMTDVAQTIINNGELAYKVMKQQYEQGENARTPEMLGGGSDGTKKISAGRA